MASAYFWVVWSFRDWPVDLPQEQALHAVKMSKGLYLFIFLPAAVVVFRRLLASRDWLLAALVVGYCVLSIWSFLAWDSFFDYGAFVADADRYKFHGVERRLYLADAAIALAGIPVALRALRLG